MQFFNRKKNESKGMYNALPSLSSLDQISMVPEPPKPVEQPRAMKEPQKMTVAP